MYEKEFAAMDDRRREIVATRKPDAKWTQAERTMFDHAIRQWHADYKELKRVAAIGVYVDAPLREGML